jgi:hypothetical protein
MAGACLGNDFLQCMAVALHCDAEASPLYEFQLSKRFAGDK